MTRFLPVSVRTEICWPKISVIGTGHHRIFHGIKKENENLREYVCQTLKAISNL